MVRSMSVEAAFELLELLKDAGLSEQDEILTFAQRIVDRHPFGCTDEDMEEIGTLVKRIRARRAATRYARRFREAAQVKRVEIPISADQKIQKPGCLSRAAGAARPSRASRVWPRPGRATEGGRRFLA
jgi:hypothetical protein